MQTNIFIGQAALVLSLFSCGNLLANEVTLDAAAKATDNQMALSVLNEGPVATTVAEAPARAVVVSGLGVPLSSDQLSSFRGGFDVVKNDMQLSGLVANNSATNIMSGNNSIADGSFANASGFPMVIQNSGSNVLIQNATIINLQYQQ